MDRKEFERLERIEKRKGTVKFLTVAIVVHVVVMATFVPFSQYDHFWAELYTHLTTPVYWIFVVAELPISIYFYAALKGDF